MRHNPMPAALLAAAALAAPLLLVLPLPAEGATTRTLAITQSLAQPKVPFKTFDSVTPKLYDFNGDGKLEIVVQNDNQWVYVFDSRTGKILAEVTTTFPSGWGARSFNGPEVAILAGGQSPRLIVENSAAMLTSFRFDPSQSTATSFKLVKEWERRLNDCHPNPGSDSRPTLVDLDRDGVLEIVATTEELGIYAIRADGRLMWKNCMGGGNADPMAADLNLDSYPDVVFGNDGGTVAALNGRTGAWLWGVHLPSRYNIGSGSMPVGAGIGQLDGLAGPDVVLGARDSHDAEVYSNNHALLVAISSTGKILWGRQDPTGNPLTYTHPVVVDADKDGRNEVYWGDWNTMGHKPPWDPAEAWAVTGPGHFYRYDAQGNLVWRQTLGTYWSNKDVPIADVDGDGVQEMLANGPNGGQDGIWYLDTRTGVKETFVSAYPYKVARAPVLGDLWGTGTMQFVMEVGPGASGSGHAVLVYDTGKPYNSAWPHVPYPNDGTGTPPPPPPTIPPPPPPGTFDATFTGVRGNEWWVQANVVASGHTIAKVEARLDGGAWTDLPKQSWGGWAKSIHVVQGTVVQLRATSGTGDTDLSGCYAWIPPSGADAATTECTGLPPPPPPPPPGAFDATFSGVKGNAWWVQVSVTANQAVAGVDARVGCGAWVPLVRQSWGGWAKSFNVPDGSKVDFRASNAGGESDYSGAYTWPTATPTTKTC